MHKGGGKGDKAEAWSLDDVVYAPFVKEYEYERIKDSEKEKNEGIYIHGLFLEGCRYARNSLDESEPKKLFAPLPILYVTAIQKKKSADTDRSS